MTKRKERNRSSENSKKNNRIRTIDPIESIHLIRKHLPEEFTDFDAAGASSNDESFSQGVTFHTGLRLLPAGNLGISQEIKPKCLVGPSIFLSYLGNGSLNYCISNSLCVQMAYYLNNSKIW